MGRALSELEGKVLINNFIHSSYFLFIVVIIRMNEAHIV